MKSKLFVLSILFFFCLTSCSKEVRVQNKIQGSWMLEEMRIVDGQGFTHYLDGVSGSLILNFDSNISEGAATFHNDFISNGLIFTNDFAGDSLELIVDQKVVYIGSNQNRNPFSLILYNSNDLVLEYYDFSSYQLRKFIFTRN